MSIPESIEQVTPEFLSDVLETEVSAVSATQIGEGTGFMGLIHRVEIEYAEPGAGAPSMIAKMPTDEEGARFVAGLMRLYEKESGFYRELAQDVPIAIPGCYYNAGDLESDKWCLLLEDITDASPGDQLQAPDASQSREMVKSLALIHAAFDGKVDDVEWLDGVGNLGIEAVATIYPEARPIVMERYGDIIPKQLDEQCAAFHEMLPGYFEAVSKLPSTLIHGDYRTDNLMFKPDGSFVVLDWQVIGRAPGSYDLYYLMGLSLDTELRRSMHDELIDLYLEMLEAQGARAPSKQDLIEQMRSVALLLGVIGTATMSQIDPANERGEELFLTMWKRGVEMATDIDCGAIL